VNFSIAQHWIVGLSLVMLSLAITGGDARPLFGHVGCTHDSRASYFRFQLPAQSRTRDESDFTITFSTPAVRASGVIFPAKALAWYRVFPDNRDLTLRDMLTIFADFLAFRQHPLHGVQTFVTTNGHHGMMSVVIDNVHSPRSSRYIVFVVQMEGTTIGGFFFTQRDFGIDAQRAFALALVETFAVSRQEYAAPTPHYAACHALV